MLIKEPIINLSLCITFIFARALVDIAINARVRIKIEYPKLILASVAEIITNAKMIQDKINSIFP